MLWLAVIAAASVFIFIGVVYSTSMPGTSHSGPLPPLTDRQRDVATRLERHVATLADAIGERNVWRMEALERAATYIEQDLRAAGYDVRPDAYEVQSLQVRNLVAERVGTSSPERIVVIGAHYDSIIGTAGANDNGTGVAAMLELARRFAEQPTDRTLRFVAFVNEEPPFCFSNTMGSRVYARRCRAQGDRIDAMLSLETIGYYSDDRGSQAYPFPFSFFYPNTGNFIGFVGNLRSGTLTRQCIKAFRDRAAFPAQGTSAPGFLPGIFWSDHWSFWKEGYRAVMVTDTAPFRYPYYHTSEDTPDKVDYERTARVVTGLEYVIEALASD